MRFVIQRVRSAAVTVEENMVGQIEKGFLVFVGGTAFMEEQLEKRQKIRKACRLCGRWQGT